MKCESVREQLWLYLYDELAAEPQAEIEAHLKQCKACAQALAEEERLYAVLRERPSREPSPALLVECRATLGDRLLDESLSWRGLLRSWFGGTPVPAPSRALAVLGLLVMGFTAGWMMRPQPEAMVGGGPAESTPVIGADLTGMRVFGIRQVAADPRTGTMRLALDAQQRLALEGTLDDPKIARILIYTVRNNQNPGIRHETLEVLGARPDDPEIRDVLLHALLNDPNAGVRREALQAVSELTWKEPLRDALLQVLARDRNPGLRVTAINLLAEHSDEAVVPVLRELAEKDQNPYIRLQCARALRRVPTEY